MVGDTSALAVVLLGAAVALALAGAGLLALAPRVAAVGVAWRRWVEERVEAFW